MREISKEDIGDCNRLIEVLQSMTEIVKKYKNSGEQDQIKYLSMYYKSLTLELFTHWI